MGMIQSALNHLTLTTIGAGATIAKGISKMKKAEASKAEEVVSNDNAKVEDTGTASLIASMKAYQSANDMIDQKARAQFQSAAERLKVLTGGKK